MDTPRSTGGLSAMNSDEEDDDDGDAAVVLDDTVVCGAAGKKIKNYSEIESKKNK
jgi:hypothetical protein